MVRLENISSNRHELTEYTLQLNNMAVQATKHQKKGIAMIILLSLVAVIKQKQNIVIAKKCNETNTEDNVGLFQILLGSNTGPQPFEDGHIGGIAARLSGIELTRYFVPGGTYAASRCGHEKRIQRPWVYWRPHGVAHRRAHSSV